MAYMDYRISEGSARRRFVGVCVGILVLLATIYGLNEGLKLRLVEKAMEIAVVGLNPTPEPLPAPPQTIPEVVAVDPGVAVIPLPQFQVEMAQVKPAITAKVQPREPVQQLTSATKPVQQPKPMQPDTLAKFHASNRIPLYPQSARANCEQGLVTLSLLIGTDGKVSKAAVATSSGYPALDDAALRVARDWRFTPASRDGSAVESAVTQPVRFDLRNEIGVSMTAAEVRACLKR